MQLYLIKSDESVLPVDWQSNGDKVDRAIAANQALYDATVGGEGRAASLHLISHPKWPALALLGFHHLISTI